MKLDRVMASDSPLSDREALILNRIVECYVQSAKPVGSRFLSKRLHLDLSPATIRNTMNDLEEKGYVRQPHVSAGRIPTDKGYRLYVNQLRLVHALTRNDRRVIQESLRSESLKMNDIFEAASRILAQLSRQLGVVLEPRFQQGIFEKMELVSVSEKKIMAVISIQSGLVKTILLEADFELTRQQLDQASRLINERLSGLPLPEIKETIDERLRGASTSWGRHLILLISKSSGQLFSFEDQEDLHCGGTHNIVSNPEFSTDSQYTVEILELIEGKRGILDHFNEVTEDSISISIGSENRLASFCNCSTISVKYHIGNISGTLGVVGPTRLHYPKIISLVEYTGKVLTQQLGSGLS